MSWTSSVDDRPVLALPPGEIDVISTVGADTCVLITVCAKGAAEALARRIHVARNSPRGRFLVVDCGLPTDALDAELFRRLERPLSARCTLFLRDVGKLVADQQLRLVTLLRQRSRACWPGPPPARVVSSTSECLFGRVADGSFNGTLFYSLNAIHLNLRRH